MPGSNDVYAAIERIRTDEAFARRVAEEGAPALARFSLASEEQTAIVLAFQRDLADELPEVSGFADVSLAGLRFDHLQALVGPT